MGRRFRVPFLPRSQPFLRPHGEQVTVGPENSRGWPQSTAGARRLRKEEKMRTWIAGLLALGMLVGWVTTATAAPHKAPSAAHLVYLCPTCGIGAARPVACPQCGKAMGRVAAYACMKDQISSDAPGPCPNCHTPTASL